MRTSFLFIATLFSVNMVLSQQVNWETYRNTKYGFTFDYPSKWVKESRDVEAVNRAGVVIAVELNFKDTISQTSLMVVYHLAPQGAELYKYQFSEYNAVKGWYKNGRKRITVAGYKGIEAFAVINKDGRGKKLPTPLRFIIIHFIDKNKTGEFEIQFKTPISSESTELIRFKQLLSGFKFIN